MTFASRAEQGRTLYYPRLQRRLARRKLLYYQRGGWRVWALIVAFACLLYVEARAQDLNHARTAYEQLQAAGVAQPLVECLSGVNGNSAECNQVFGDYVQECKKLGHTLALCMTSMCFAGLDAGMQQACGMDAFTTQP